MLIGISNWEVRLWQSLHADCIKIGDDAELILEYDSRDSGWRYDATPIRIH